MIDPNVIDAMLAAGCTAEQIAAVVKADARAETDKIAARREVDRVRKRNQRARETLDETTFASGTSRGHAVTGRDASDGADTVSPKEIPPTPPKEITPSDIPPATPKGVSAPKPTPRSELVAILSPLQADAVIAHRQRIGKPMTAHAAHLLAGKFARCSDPDAAADAMISNGWQGFEPEWLERGQPRAGPASQSKPPQMADVFKLIKETENGRQEREDRSGAGAAVSYLPAVRSG